MREARFLPTAADELRQLDGKSQRRVLGALMTLRRGEREGESCDVPEGLVRRLCVWHFVIIYTMVGQVVWVTEVGIYGQREAAERVQEIERGIVDLREDDDRCVTLKTSLSLLQPTG